MNLSTRHMKAFSALAATRNFTRAAEFCNLTQSAFSALISNLESGLGVRLFSRNTRNVELTAEGEVFLEMVDQLLPEVERALAGMRDYVERRKGRIALAALPSIASSILPSLMARFLAMYPGIELVVQDVSSTVCAELVRSRQVDFALCASTSVSAGLDSETLASDGFYFICAQDHPLARRRRLAVADVLPHPIVVYEQNSSIRQHLDASIYPRQWARGFEVNSLSTAAGLVAAGLGVTVVPTLALFHFRIRGLRAIPLALPIDRRDICLIRRKDSTDSLAAQAFIGLLREGFADAMRDLEP